MTVFVAVEAGVIVDTAPITRRFIGQPAANMRRWFVRLGGYQSQRMG